MKEDRNYVTIRITYEQADEIADLCENLITHNTGDSLKERAKRVQKRFQYIMVNMSFDKEDI